jgi:predicted DsbA family dithiol-disulfide isomerase
LQVIRIYFDYVCPYCLIANANVNRFRAKYSGVSFEWKPWEIVPETPKEGIHLDLGKVSPPLAKLAEEAGLWLPCPTIQPNSHLALLGLFYAKENGRFQDYHNAVFDALWNHDENIGQLNTLGDIMQKVGLSQEIFRSNLENDDDRYERMLTESEQDAVKDNVELAPTYMSDGNRIIGNVSARRVEKFIKRIAAAKEAQRKE